MKTAYLLDREVGHVLAALTPSNRLVCRVCLHTGLRVGDVLALRTRQLAPRFWVTERKTRKRRQVGLPAGLLADIRAQAGEIWAFPGRDPADLGHGRPYGQTSNGPPRHSGCLRTWPLTASARSTPWTCSTGTAT